MRISYQKNKFMGYLVFDLIKKYFSQFDVRIKKIFEKNTNTHITFLNWFVLKNNSYFKIYEKKIQLASF